MISLDDLLQRKKKSVFNNNINLSSVNNITPSRLFHSDETNKFNNRDEEVSFSQAKGVFNSNTNTNKSADIDEELRDTVEELRDSVHPLNNTSTNVNNVKNKNNLSNSSGSNNNIIPNRNAGKRNPMDEE